MNLFFKKSLNGQFPDIAQEMDLNIMFNAMIKVVKITDSKR